MSKTEYKTELCLLDVLTRLDNGETPPDIRKAYGWKRGRLDYWLKGLEEEGLITLVGRTNHNIYSISPQGRNFLTQHQSGFDGLMLHNVEFKYAVLEEGQFAEDKRWFWGKRLIRAKKLSGCTVKLIDHTLVISVEHLPGNDSFKLADEAKVIADKTVDWLKSQGFSLGDGRISRKPHFGIMGPLAKRIAEQVQISADTYQINASQGGEAEFFTPETADSYMRMPEKLAKIEAVLSDKLTPALEALTEQITLHLAVMQEMRDTLKLMREEMKK